jgi:hypothetical membrane protein
MDQKRISGILILVGTVIFILGMTAAQLLYPGYNMSENYISDLGVGSSSAVFNGAAMIFGLLIVLASIQLPYQKKYSAFVTLGGLGLVLVGVFSAPSPLHAIGAILAFLIGGLFAASPWKTMKKPFSYLSVLGVLSLVALVLWSVKQYMGLGPGGMELVIAYPLLIFLLIFSVVLIKKSNIR